MICWISSLKHCVGRLVSFEKEVGSTGVVHEKERGEGFFSTSNLKTHMMISQLSEVTNWLNVNTAVTESASLS